MSDVAAALRRESAPSASGAFSRPETVTAFRGSPGWVLPLPTARTARLIAGAAVVMLLGAVHPAFGWLSALLVAGVLVACCVDWMALPGGSDLELRRADRPVLSLGSPEQLEVEVRLRGDVGGNPGVEFRAVDDLPDALVQVQDPAPASPDSRGAARFTTTVEPRRRGRHQLGCVHLRARSRWGLAERETRFEARTEIRVYPGIRGTANAARMLRRGLREQLGSRRHRRRGEGTAFESLREYVPGEDPRHMDWKATAKAGKLVSRHYEVERSQNLMLLIDGGRWMTTQTHGLTRYDHVLNACLLLAKIAALRDDRVGVLAFSRDVDAFVPPSKGRAAVQRLMEAVYEIQPQMVESDYGRAFQYLSLKHRKRSLVILFTDLLGREASRVVMQEFARLSRRHLPLLVAIRDTDLGKLTDAVPTSASAAYRQAAAEELLLERAQALALLRARGVHVLDATVSELGPALIDRYLELKARLLL